MKCEICKAKTDWDSSMGRPNFLICKDCTNKLLIRFGAGKFESVIFAISDIRTEKEEGR